MKLEVRDADNMIFQVADNMIFQVAVVEDMFQLSFMSLRIQRSFTIPNIGLFGLKYTLMDLL